MCESTWPAQAHSVISFIPTLKGQRWGVLIGRYPACCAPHFLLRDYKALHLDLDPYYGIEGTAWYFLVYVLFRLP